jgi:hypothetical protein
MAEWTVERAISRAVKKLAKAVRRGDEASAQVYALELALMLDRRARELEWKEKHGLSRQGVTRT